MPESEQELDFITVAIAHKLLTHEEAEEAQHIQEQEVAEGKDRRPIEEILLERGILTKEEVWAVHKAQDRLTRDAKGGGKKIGGYEILGLLGEGGLGVVYKARQISMNRIVALKVLHEKWVNDDEFRKRFLLEARLVGRLSHPNLIQVFDIGRHRNTFFYSMEFVDGETVESILDREGALDPLRAVEIVLQIARALQYLAEHKIVHRDVKPGNIMVTRSGIAKLGDFGFVQSSLDSVLSPAGEVLGTPDYISPEASLGEKDLDYRSDLYSLGASFYHMLGGEPPFRGTASEVMDAHIHKEPTPLEEIRPMLPRKAIAIVEKLMAKKREERYSQFVELFEDLEQLRAELLAEAPPSAPRSEDQRRLDELLLQVTALRRENQRLRIALGGLSLGLLIALFIVWKMMRGGS